MNAKLKKIFLFLVFLIALPLSIGSFFVIQKRTYDERNVLLKNQKEISKNDWKIMELIPNSSYSSGRNSLFDIDDGSSSFPFVPNRQVFDTTNIFVKDPNGNDMILSVGDYQSPYSFANETGPLGKDPDLNHSLYNSKIFYSDIDGDGEIGDENIYINDNNQAAIYNFDSIRTYNGSYSYVITKDPNNSAAGNTVYLKLSTRYDGGFENLSDPNAAYKKDYKFTNEINLRFDQINEIKSEDLPFISSPSEIIVDLNFNANNVENNGIDKTGKYYSIPNYVITKNIDTNKKKLYYWNENPAESDDTRWNVNTFHEPYSEGVDSDEREFRDIKVYKFMNDMFGVNDNGEKVYTPSVFVEVHNNVGKRELYFWGYAPDIFNSATSELKVKFINGEKVKFYQPKYTESSTYISLNNPEMTMKDSQLATGLSFDELTNNRLENFEDGSNSHTYDRTTVTLDDIPSSAFITGSPYRLDNIYPAGDFGWYFVFSDSSSGYDVVYYWGVGFIPLLENDIEHGEYFINQNSDGTPVEYGTNFENYKDDVFGYGVGYDFPIRTNYLKPLDNFDDSVDEYIEEISIENIVGSQTAYAPIITDPSLNVENVSLRRLPFFQIIYKTNKDPNSKSAIISKGEIYSSKEFMYLQESKDIYKPFLSTNNFNLILEDSVLSNFYEDKKNNATIVADIKNSDDMSVLREKVDFFLDRKSGVDTKNILSNTFSFRFLGSDNKIYVSGINNAEHQSSDPLFFEEKILPQYVYIPKIYYLNPSDAISVDSSDPDATNWKTSITFSMTNPEQTSSENLIQNFKFVFKELETGHLSYKDVDIKDCIINENGTYTYTFTNSDSFFETGHSYTLIGYDDETRKNIFWDSETESYQFSDIFTWRKDEQPFFRFGSQKQTISNIEISDVNKNGFIVSLTTIYNEPYIENFNPSDWRFKGKIVSKTTNFVEEDIEFEFNYLNDQDSVSGNKKIFKFEIINLVPNTLVTDFSVYQSNFEKNIYNLDLGDSELRTTPLENPYIENSFKYDPDSITDKSFDFEIKINDSEEYEEFNPDDLKLFCKAEDFNGNEISAKQELAVIKRGKSVTKSEVTYYFSAVNLEPDTIYSKFYLNPVYTGQGSDSEQYEVTDMVLSTILVPTKPPIPVRKFDWRGIFILGVIFAIIAIIAMIISFTFVKKKRNVYKIQEKKVVEDYNRIIEYADTIRTQIDYSNPQIGYNNYQPALPNSSNNYLPQQINSAKLRYKIASPPDLINSSPAELQNKFRLYYSVDGNLYLAKTKFFRKVNNYIEYDIYELEPGAVYTGICYSIDSGMTLLPSLVSHAITKDYYNQSITIDEAVLPTPTTKPIAKLPNPDFFVKLSNPKIAKETFEILALKHFERDYNADVKYGEEKLCLPIYLELWYRIPWESAVKWVNLTEEEKVKLNKFRSKYPPTKKRNY